MVSWDDSGAHWVAMYAKSDEQVKELAKRGIEVGAHYSKELPGYGHVTFHHNGEIRHTIYASLEQGVGRMHYERLCEIEKWMYPDKIKNGERLSWDEAQGWHVEKMITKDVK